MRGKRGHPLRRLGQKLGQVLGQDAFDLFLVPAHGGAAFIADLKLGRRIQQSAAAKPPLIGIFGVILIGVEHRKDALPWVAGLRQPQLVKPQPFRMPRLQILVHQIGLGCEVVIKAFLGKYTVEQQGYKSCIALQKLTEKYSPERLEAACSKAFSFTSSPSFKSILSILRSGQDKLPEASKSEEENLSVSQYGFTRGAKYYEGGDE